MLTNLSMQKQNPSGLGSLPNNIVANPRGDVKAITTRSGFAYDGPMIPPMPSPLPKEMKRETEATKDKVQPTTSTPLNKNCSTVLLKKLPEKLGDPGKLLIPCDFSELEECLALADLGASINLMPLFVWKKLSLPELTPTRMTLEHANRSVAIPVGVVEDVFMKVGKFYFPTDFVVVDYDAIMFKVGHTSRYSRNYYGETVHQVNVIDVACEEYAQEVLGFLDSSKSGNPTPSDPIITSFSPSFTHFEGGDFILEEIQICLRTPNELSKLDDNDFDPEGDIALIKKLLNEDPPLNLPPMKNEDLKQADVTMTKPSIKEPPKLQLKDLPSHLEYAFLEGTDKLPVIISKELKDKEKTALLKVLRGSTSKKDDPKIHEVIKKEVIKLLDAELIYPISNSPWISIVVLLCYEVGKRVRVTGDIVFGDMVLAGKFERDDE
nr:hypothetical protein [Tanacetum cinerariifolium]